MFHNSNVFGSCIIHILYTGCAKIKKIISGAKRLRQTPPPPILTTATDLIYSVCEGRDCSVSIATLYKLNDPGVESR